MVSSTNENIHKGFLDLARDISFGDIKGTYEIVVATVAALKDIVANTEWSTAKSLMESVKRNGKYLMNVAPVEASIGNMVRRILHIIREEFLEMDRETNQTEESLHNILTSEGDKRVDYDKALPALRSALIEHIGEFQAELETCEENITQQALEHIHSNEIIMTFGRSRLVENFFKRIAQTRPFEVIVAEGGPFLDGHEMASNLSKSQIKTTLISDAAIFAMMSRVNKVIIGTQTVMANGGLRAVSGSHTVAQAAKHYSVPVMVLLPLYKLSPLYVCAYDKQPFNKHVSPLQGVMRSDNAALLEQSLSYNPVFDYVPPDLVTLFVSNTGGNAPSYIYRLISEQYHPDDYDL